MLKWQKLLIIYLILWKSGGSDRGLGRGARGCRGPERGLGRLSAKGTRCGGLLPYFFMRATVTEERQNEWLVKINENE